MFFLNSTSPATLTIENTRFHAGSYGVFITHNNTGTDRISLSRVTIDHVSGAGAGVYADANGKPGGVRVQIKDSTISNSPNGVWAKSTTGAALVSNGITHSDVTGND